MKFELSISEPSIKAVINDAALAFRGMSDTAKLDAEILLLHVIEKPKAYLFTWPDAVLTPEQLEHFTSLVEKRLLGHPIAHLIGKRDFWTLTLEVNNSTLIPRPDTELLIERVLSSISDSDLPTNGTGLDLGTGTGAIALSLASELPEMQWLGSDFSQDAVNLATRNKSLNNINNCTFIQSDWYSALGDQRFDIIVSNPPYIDPQDPHLNQGDVRFEPKSALIADNYGKSDITHIVERAPHFLNSPGLIAIEHGYDQGEFVRQCLAHRGFKNINTFIDLGQNDRITIGYF